MNEEFEIKEEPVELEQELVIKQEPIENEGVEHLEVDTFYCSCGQDFEDRQNLEIHKSKCPEIQEEDKNPKIEETQEKNNFPETNEIQGEPKQTSSEISIHI